MADMLRLKWGTLKACDIQSEKGQAALEKIFELGDRCVSAACQHDTTEQKQALCDLIDVLDCETVRLDWTGVDLSKEEAKKYVMEYE